MGRIKRGNYIFVYYIGDHGYHVHVYKDKNLVLKWDLDKNMAIKGKPRKKILSLIKELKAEGLL